MDGLDSGERSGSNSVLERERGATSGDIGILSLRSLQGSTQGEASDVAGQQEVEVVWGQKNACAISRSHVFYLSTRNLSTLTRPLAAR